MLVQSSDTIDLKLVIKPTKEEIGHLVTTYDFPFDYIAGILDDGPVSELGPKMAAIEDALHELGYRHKNVIMALSTLGLPVSPYLKVTDKGLVDVRRQKIVKLYEWV